MAFTKMLQQRWSDKTRMLCVGLDPDLAKMPASIQRSEQPFYAFAREIIDATADYVCAYKPQIAYYAAYGAEVQLEKTIAYIKDNYPQIPVILDAKRGDIGDTASMYAKEAFERYQADAVTVNPYMGGDTIDPYLAYGDKGVIILCRTSNIGSSEFQTLKCDGEMLALRVAKMALAKSAHNKNIALVVGATYADELRVIRQIVGEMPLLVPGVGAQGGDLSAVIQNGLDANAQGLIINSSRAVIYAGHDDDFAEKAAAVCQSYQHQIAQILNAN